MHHLRKVEKSGVDYVVCNYCVTAYKMHKSSGYGNLIKHVRNHHQMKDAKVKEKGQTKINRFATSSSDKLFIYSNKKIKNV